MTNLISHWSYWTSVISKHTDTTNLFLITAGFAHDLHQFRYADLPSVGRIVDRNDRLNIQLQPRDVVHEVLVVRADRSRRLRYRFGWRIECVGLQENLFFREIGDDQSFIVTTPPKVVQLYDVITVGEGLFFRHGFDRRLLLRRRQLVRSERVRHVEEFLVIRLVDLMRDDRSAFRHERPESARMIEVLMRVDHILDRLVRNQPLGFRDNRAGTLFTLWSLNYDDVILEVHRDARIATQDEVHTIREFLRRRSSSGRSSGRCGPGSSLRVLDIRRSIGFHVGN